jgi:hypothetical protein
MDDLINYPVHVSFFEIKIGKEGDSLGNVIAFSSIYFRETFTINYAFNPFGIRIIIIMNEMLKITQLSSYTENQNKLPTDSSGFSQGCLKEKHPYSYF